MTLFDQAISQEALLPMHLAKGLILDEDDTHTVLLKNDKSEIIARYSSTGVKAEQIRQDANRWLKGHK